MPIFGIGLHVLIALFFAVHAIRHGQQLFWLIVLFSFPLLGSVVYFFAIYLPNSRLEHGARKVAVAAAKSLDPGRALREARAAFDYTPTAQNQMRLASALLDSGAGVEAADTYEACLRGAFASDLEIRFGAARANLACGRARQAIEHLESIQRSDANFRAEPVALLLAQSYAAAGRRQEARDAFEAALARFGSFECQAEYAIWAAGAGEKELAERHRQELQRTVERWSRHTRGINADLLRRVNAALGGNL
ncbi:hypothetical protein [Janthinobacterium fluminis]|uniref:Tetratricopeptide repeat protein n=1 Tax=Janthinobacterium fluminis TaxID=2987524 RepID=A0ABT5K2L8_9BURK|nr:hypothetical protein [Janthinobacterium fluminis]MDC8758925.1 hypothetical protein [Janthinobacterium fluminis]